MGNNIAIYSTNEITDDLWKQIISGFNKSFAEHTTTKQHLVNGYRANAFGYSYHALYFADDKLVGFNSIIPNYYSTNLILGLSGSTFVLEEYRKDIFIFADMYNALKIHCAELGIVAFLGVPNSNSYQYSLKLLQCKEIGLLPYYILPLRISYIIGKSRLKIFDPLSLLYSYALIGFNSVLSRFINTKERIAKYRIDCRDNYYHNRFADNSYTSITNNHIRFTYTLYKENNATVAYIMDFREREMKSSVSLLSAVRYIVKHEKIDAIMYIGTMNLSQCILTKVPHRFEPRALHYTYIETSKQSKNVYSDMKKMRNWDFSLMNLDVR